MHYAPLKALWSKYSKIFRKNKNWGRIKKKGGSQGNLGDFGLRSSKTQCMAEGRLNGLEAGRGAVGSAIAGARGVTRARVTRKNRARARISCAWHTARPSST